MTLNSCFPSIRLTLTQAESGRSPSECSRSNFLLDDCKASWREVGIVESARLWFQWRSGHVSASLSARRTRTYGPACGRRPEVVETLAGLLHALMKQMSFASPMQCFSNASITSRRLLGRHLRQTERCGRYAAVPMQARNTAARFFAAASIRSTAISYLFHSFLKRPQSAAMSPPSFSGDGAGMVFTVDAAVIDGDDIV